MGVWKKLAVGAGGLALVLAGVAVAAVLQARARPDDRLDTRLADISVITPTTSPPPTTRAAQPVPRPKPKPRREPAAVEEKRCWQIFGGNAQRTLARRNIQLGPPTKHLWVRGMKGYMEYPPSYCDGRLYVNTYKGVTFALDAETGRVIWRRKGGPKPSTPAIAGPRLIVSSTDGTVTAFQRVDGRLLWQLRTNAKVESSPLVIDQTVYFGATDGRLFAVDVRTGRVRWAYDTGGRINSSPSAWGNRIYITTYAGSIFCLRRSDGKRLWRTYIRRDTLRYESFYASASTDGKRVYTISRSGKVVVLNARTGQVVWTRDQRGYGYSTPAVAAGRIFVGGFDGALHAYRSTTGRELWRRYVGGRVLGPALVVGDLVLFSTLEQKTYAVRAVDGRVVWQIGVGKYAPGIATERHYYLSLNGLLIKFRGARTAAIEARALANRRKPTAPDSDEPRAARPERRALDAALVARQARLRTAYERG